MKFINFEYLECMIVRLRITMTREMTATNIYKCRDIFFLRWQLLSQILNSINREIFCHIFSQGIFFANQATNKADCCLPWAGVDTTVSEKKKLKILFWFGYKGHTKKDPKSKENKGSEMSSPAALNKKSFFSSQVQCVFLYF